jgi:glycosyltransferase involved in cell wall biosynthesis
MLLSIVIPSYNHRDFVLKTIRAALAIDIADKEIFVIDDGSTDGSAQVIRAFVSKLSSQHSVTLIARENRGLVATLGEGLGLAHGAYFYGVASDDIPNPDGIVQLIEILERETSLQFAMGNVLYMESESQTEFHSAYGDSHKRFFSLAPGQREREIFLNYPQPLLLQGTVFRRAALVEMGGWRSDIKLDDMATFIRLLSRYPRHESEFCFRPDIVACLYRRHDTNVSRNVERQYRLVEEVIDKLSPPQWRDLALLKNLVGHATIAVNQKKFSAAGRMCLSTFRRLRLHRSAISILREGPAAVRLRNQLAASEPDRDIVRSQSVSEIIRSSVNEG